MTAVLGATAIGDVLFQLGDAANGGDVLKMAVVGVGALGRHHARILSEFDDVQLVAVAEPNRESGSAVAEACGTRWVADARELLGQVDAVSVVVPTSSAMPK